MKPTAIRAAIAAVCVAMPVFGAAAPDLKAEAAREGKPCMVLCVGADWCVSGESVRRVYDSPEFRRALRGRWLFGVHDVWESSPPESVAAENARVKSLDIGTSRFPALMLFNSRGEPIKAYTEGSDPLVDGI